MKLPIKFPTRALLGAASALAGAGVLSLAACGGGSKTVFVLGVEQGLRFVEAHPGVDAVIVDAHGTLHYSAGLQG